MIFLSSFAAALNGCGDDQSDWVEAKRCVDPDNVVMAHRLCDSESPNRHYDAHSYGGHGYYRANRA